MLIKWEKWGSGGIGGKNRVLGCPLTMSLGVTIVTIMSFHQVVHGWNRQRAYLRKTPLNAVNSGVLRE